MFYTILFVCYSRKMNKGSANQLFITLVLFSLVCAIADMGMEIPKSMLDEVATVNGRRILEHTVHMMQSITTVYTEVEYCDRKEYWLMKMFKLLISVFLIGAMMVCASACSGGGSSEEAVDNTEEPAEAVSGGWEIGEADAAAELPKAVDKAFRKATKELDGNKLEPAAYIGSQVVAGSNYMILCRSTSVTENPETRLQMAVIYADLDGGAKLTSLEDFDVTKYTQGEGTLDSKTLAGGWFVPDDACGSEIPKEASAAFDKAAETVDWSWSKVTPLAFLGSQVVAGTNYALLCKADSPDDSPSTIVVMTIYQDLEGKAEITNTCGLDLAEFSGQ